MISLSQLGEDRINGNEIDLSGIPVEDQGVLLRDLEHQHRTKGTTDTNIFILNYRAHTLLKDMGGIQLGLHDIDGTHTPVGGYRLTDASMDGLSRSKDSGMDHVAVTGRHEWQVRELLGNHLRSPFSEWLIEQGFYKLNNKGEVVLFEGTEVIEANVGLVRAYLDPLLPELKQRHGVDFETTSKYGEGDWKYPHAHQTMYSMDATQRGRKIDDIELHERILVHIDALWREHDTELRIATPRTSSIGTFELTPDGVNKEGAVRSLLSERGLDPRVAAYFGDSSNDLPVFEGMPDLGLRAAIIQKHTKNVILKNADVAAVGLNTRPILDRLTKARHAAQKIIIQTSDRTAVEVQ